MYGLAAGFAATVLLSALARIPAIREPAEEASLAHPSRAEDDDPSNALLPLSPAAALVQTSGPGPEGPAGLFAAKVASGLFGRDLAKRTKVWGRVVHLAYGSFWGMVYGMLQNKSRRRPQIAGASHGMLVWAFGPAVLVPAMKLMPPPSKVPREQTALNFAAHVIYGVTLAQLFNLLSRRGPAHDSPGS